MTHTNAPNGLWNRCSLYVPRCSCTISLMNGDDSRPSGDASGNWQYRRGDTIDAAAAPQTADTSAQNTTEQSPQPMIHADEYAPSPALQPAPPAGANDVVSWSASEFIAHHKTAGWYGLLVLATAFIAGIVFLFTRDKISTSVIIFVGVIFGVSAGRKPRTLGYRVDGASLTIGQKVYSYDKFRSFAVVQEDAFSSIVLMPLQRFMPLITIYYDPKDEQRIVDILAERLPVATHKLDWVDQLMRRVRF